MPKPTRKRISHKLTAPTGLWSVCTPEGYIAEGVSEPAAWSKFLRATGRAVLLKGATRIAER